MMNSLYEAANRFRAEKPWREIAEDELIAFMYGDTVRYCAVGTNEGSEHELIVFVDAQSVANTIRMQQPDLNDRRRMEAEFARNLCVCSLMAASDMPKAQLREARAYCADAGIAPRGKGSYPAFRTQKAYHLDLDFDPDNAGLMEAAFHAVSMYLKWSKDIRGQVSDTDRDTFAVLVSPAGWKKIAVPSGSECAYAPIEPYDEFTAFRINKKVGNMWAAEIAMLPAAGEGESDRCVFTCMVMDLTDDRIAELVPMTAPDTHAGLREILCRLMLTSGRPARIYFEDDRTMAIMAPCFAALGVGVERREIIPQLDEAMEGLFDHLDSDGIYNELEELLDDDPEALIGSMPDGVLMAVMQSGDVPEALMKMIREEAKRRGML